MAGALACNALEMEAHVQNLHPVRSRARLLSLSVVTLGLVALLALFGQQAAIASRGLAAPTPASSPVAPHRPVTQDAAAPAQCDGMDCAITSRVGWQETPLTPKRGEQFSVAYLGGTWTVDQRSLPFVGPAGYSSDVDSQIGYPECKVDGRWPYAALLGKIGDGPVFLVGGGGGFTAERDGALSLHINDATFCQGDNEGSVSVRVAKPPCARLSVVPSYKEISLGDTGATEVRVADVVNLYGVQFRVNFDPDVVQGVDADPNMPGVQMEIGSLFSGKDYFVARNSVDNAAGVGEFVVTLVAPATPISGTGALAVITWQGKNAGQSPITLTLTGLAPASPICHTIENGSIRVGRQGQVISGRVLLQAAQDHSGTSVFLTEAPRTCATKICAQELSNVPLDVTDREGRFEVSPFAGRSYPWLWAYHACYLTGVKRWPQGDLGTLTLPAGDLNEDNCVNIYDLTKMAWCYGTTGCSCADFNQDGKVDIFDLTLVASNFGRCGSVDDWRP